MDEFFQIYTSPESMFLWSDEHEPLTVVNQSAFRRYAEQLFKGLAVADHHQNVNKRMIEFLKKMKTGPAEIESIEHEQDRSRKHKISERMRREKHKQNYVAIHKLLPHGTKTDKKSILEMAAKEIEEVKQYKEELERQNREMEMILGASGSERAVEKAEIKLRVDYPASGIDSMLAVLRCLRDTGSTATAIQSTFSDHEFSATLEVHTKIRAVYVEKAVQRSLFEAEIKLRNQVNKENANCLKILESGQI